MAMSVHLPWNNLIGEGLLAYGFRDEAAQLTTRLMNAVVSGLKDQRGVLRTVSRTDGCRHGGAGLTGGRQRPWDFS